MDSPLVEFLFTVGFVMLGSLVFHVSTLISGYSIYREMSSVESGFLSTAIGLVIFLISPIGFVVLMSEGDSVANQFLIDILDSKVIIPFFLSAMGLGLVFGYLSVLQARVNVLTWLREKSGIPFWILCYGVLWDMFLTSAKKGGEILVYKKSNNNDCKKLEGAIISSSIRNETREIEIKLKDSGDRCLIPGTEIDYIQIPEKSFSKHYEMMSHIGQAWCCLNIAIGLFFIAISASITMSVDSIKDIQSISLFYEIAQQLFLLSSLVILVLSVWIAKKDFNNWKSYFLFCPDFSFFSICFSVLFLSLSFPINLYDYKYIMVIFSVAIFAAALDAIYNNNLLTSDRSFYFFIFGMFLLYLFFACDEIVVLYKGSFDISSPYTQYSFSFVNIILMAAIFMIYFGLIRPRIKIDNMLDEKVIQIIENKDDYKKCGKKLYKYIENLLDMMWLEMCINDPEKSSLEYLEKILINEKLKNKNLKYKNLAQDLINILKDIEIRESYLNAETPTILYTLHRIIKKKRTKI